MTEPHAPIFIAHPSEYKTGTRVLMLTSRHKDGHSKERKVFRISHDAEEYDSIIGKFTAMMNPGERIYASAASRDLAKAARRFKERQLNAEYDQDPLSFYRCIEARWTSCLMDTASAASKIWMFDADTDEQVELVKTHLLSRTQADGSSPYAYATKNGLHVILPAFNLQDIPPPCRELLHKDPLILVAY